MSFERGLMFKSIINKFFWFLVFAIILVGSCYSVLSYKIGSKSYKVSRKFGESIKELLGESTRSTLSKKFKEIALENSECVLRSKLLAPGLKNCSNGSIVQNKDEGYFLFFRQDTWLPFKTYKTSIHVVKLDKNFNCINEPKKLTPKCAQPEDPRAFITNGEIYCLYNDLIDKSGNKRGMYLAKFDRELEVFCDVQDLNFSSQKIEKNWTPFFEGLKDGNLRVIYDITPHTIYDINLADRALHIQFSPYENYASLERHWEPYFGRPRGGAPIVSVGDKFLNVFHSFIRDNEEGTIWYLMGAYLFEKEPPYAITAYTSKPIFFDDIYTSDITNPHGKGKKVIYPSGITQKRENGRNVLHISCGENDSNVRVVTIDEELLISSMTKVESK
jgi:predicted GH43/DUF377 family glycosyl hydrolase